NQYAKAIEAKEKAVSIEPNNAEYWDSLSTSYHLDGQYAKAIETAEKAVSIDPNNACLWDGLGLSYHSEGQYAKAIEAKEKAVSIEAGNAEYWDSLCISYYNIGQIIKAIETAETATNLDPKNANYWYNLGISLHKAKMYDKAILAKKKSVGLVHDNVKYLYSLSLSYWSKGKETYAYKHLIRAKSTKNRTGLIKALGNTLDILVKDYDVEGLRFFAEHNIDYLSETQYYFLEDILTAFKDTYEIQSQMIRLQLHIKRIMNILACQTNSTTCQPKELELAHYTKITYIGKLLKKDSVVKLRLNNASYMNDPSEGILLVEYLTNHYLNNRLMLEGCKKFSNTSDTNPLTSNVYLFSLTSTIDSLPMWAQYGEQGMGCCLILDNNFFDFADDEMQHDMRVGAVKKSKIEASEPWTPYAVVYINDKDKSAMELNNAEILKEIEEISKTLLSVEKLCEQGSDLEKKLIEFISECIDQIRFLFKSVDYDYEQEFRIIKYAAIDSERIRIDNEAIPVPHLFIERNDDRPLKYSKLIIGPKVTQVNSITPYIRYVDNNIMIEKSKVKFR
ncbi:MAG TPA: tetratricopeptide repeat protein, partial [Patescibacteria group bacterium]|nr:tetratricopeptide repeat protein [Patescibacteria group bacterium]